MRARPKMMEVIDRYKYECSYGTYEYKYTRRREERMRLIRGIASPVRVRRRRRDWPSTYKMYRIGIGRSYEVTNGSTRCRWPTLGHRSGKSDHVCEIMRIGLTLCFPPLCLTLSIVEIGRSISANQLAILVLFSCVFLVLLVVDWDRELSIVFSLV